MKGLDLLMLKFLAKTLGITEKAAAALLFKPNAEDSTKLTDELQDNALENLLAQDAERVNIIKAAGGGDEGAKFTEGYNKGKAETLTKFEKDLRTKYAIEDKDVKGVALIEAIVQGASKENGGGKLNDDDVKKHPLFRSLETQMQEAIAAKDTEYTTKITDIESNYKRNETVAQVKARAQQLLTSKKPILPKNAVAAENQIKAFLSQFDEYEYEVTGDQILLMDKTTKKRLEDKHSHALKFEDVVNDKASAFFEFQVQGAKGAPGNENGGSGTIVAPSNDAEYKKAIFNAKTADERKAVHEAYTAGQGS